LGCCIDDGFNQPCDPEPPGRKHGHVRRRRFRRINLEIIWGDNESPGDREATGGIAAFYATWFGQVADSVEEPGCVGAHSQFDGGQPDADCLTPQLRTNGHLSTNYKRNLLTSVAITQGMP
jgi:hypothetical protein